MSCGSLLSFGALCFFGSSLLALPSFRVVSSLPALLKAWL
jgi:hypothetical protein